MGAVHAVVAEPCDQVLKKVAGRDTPCHPGSHMLSLAPLGAPDRQIPKSIIHAVFEKFLRVRIDAVVRTIWLPLHSL